jgi:hypothetical protein
MGPGQTNLDAGQPPLYPSGAPVPGQPAPAVPEPTVPAPADPFVGTAASVPTFGGTTATSGGASVPLPPAPRETPNVLPTALRPAAKPAVEEGIPKKQAKAFFEKLGPEKSAEYYANEQAYREMIAQMDANGTPVEVKQNVYKNYINKRNELIREGKP